jgi:hypothetical protein
VVQQRSRHQIRKHVDEGVDLSAERRRDPPPAGVVAVEFVEEKRAEHHDDAQVNRPPQQQDGACPGKKQRHQTQVIGTRQPTE